MSRYESRRHASPLPDVDGRDGVAVSVLPDFGAVDLVWRVRRAIDSLPPKLTDVVRMQHLEGMTHPEIAEKLGLALGTVKSRSHRAHRILASQLRDLR
jgi:RNA polymerase sigma-70 factor (ECF subfamily)